MSKAAPYTRETIARIRHLAGANTSAQIGLELGWDRSRVEKIAKLHGIEVVPGGVPAARAITAPPGAPVPVARVQPPAPSNADFVFGDIKWSPSLAEVERGGRLVAMPRNQNAVFGVLLREISAGNTEPLLAAWIAERIGLSIGVATVVQGLRQRLKPLHIDVVAQKGRGGGFRLIINPWPEWKLPAPSELMA